MKNSNSKGKILIVEDEYILFEELKELFESAGYTVSEYLDNYTEALDSARQMQPDMAILDIRLNFDKSPEDGVILAKQLKSEMGIPIIFLSSKNDSDTIRKIRAIQESNFLIKTKPILNHAQLLTSVQLAIGSINLGLAQEQELVKALQQEFVDGDADNHGIFASRKVDHKFEKVLLKFETIQFIKADGNDIKIHVDEGKPFERTIKMHEVLKLLSPEFIRIHSSWIVNVSKISTYTNEYVMIGNYKIPIGGQDKGRLFELLKRRYH